MSLVEVAMEWLKKLGILPFGIMLAAPLKADEARITFPAVSTILNADESAKLQNLVQNSGQQKVCYTVQGYFSAQEGQWTYRIVGRARVLEVYRQLVLQGVHPKDIHISSLGPLNESREYRDKPPGLEVLTKAHKAESSICQTPEENRQKPAMKDLKEPILLEYEVLDGDPKQESAQAFLDHIRARKDDPTAKWEVTTYADATGSRYLNLLLSRLRALVLFRMATLEGARPDSITLQWRGQVSREDKELPAPIVEVQRRSLVEFQLTPTENAPRREAVPPPEAAPAPETAPSSDVVTSSEPPAVTQESGPSPLQGWAIGVIAGLATPPSSIQDDVKNGGIFGLVLRKEWDSKLGLEGILTQQSHARTKDPDVSGSVAITSLRLGVNYQLISAGPGVVLLHGGLIAHSWKGEATYKPNGENNTDDGTDLGLYTAGGYLLPLTQNLYSAARLETSFSQSSLDGWMHVLAIELGWRF
jgi:hypothetical protein